MVLFVFNKELLSHCERIVSPVRKKWIEKELGLSGKNDYAAKMWFRQGYYFIKPEEKVLS